MTLDRESIERKDFPLARRGYEPSAVDAHLRLLADEVEQLRRGAHSPTETLATAISERVRGIVEAAEASAAEILASAELEARELRMEASEAAERARLEATGEAEREREEAAAKAQDYVSRLSSSISEMLERLDGMDGELNALTASLRTGTERLRGELTSLEDELEGVITATSGGLAGEEHPPPTRPTPAASGRRRKEAARPVAADFLESSPESAKIGDAPPEESFRSRDLDAPMTAAAPEGAGAHGAGLDHVAPAPSREQPLDEPATPRSGESAADPADDTEGARLIALNMALNGTAREETDRYLAENYDLHDRQRLLDEVYASVEG